MQEYETGRLPLYHFDVYRVSDEDELFEIGLEDYFHKGGVCLVEWPENVAGLLPPETLWIRITRDLEKGPEYRKITITGEVPDEDPGH